MKQLDVPIWWQEDGLAVQHMATCICLFHAKPQRLTFVRLLMGSHRYFDTTRTVDTAACWRTGLPGTAALCLQVLQVTVLASQQL